jgi:hypothetical protein
MLDRGRHGTTLVLPTDVDAASRSGDALVPLGTGALAIAREVLGHSSRGLEHSKTLRG